jgi:hypothetical protein
MGFPKPSGRLGSGTLSPNNLRTGFPMIRHLFQKALVLALTACLWWPSWAWALDQKDGLRGLTGVHVVVEDLRPEVERLGLTKKVVQRTVEQRLRRMKIKVLGKPKPPALSTLHIVVKTFDVKSKGILVYGINLMLMEYAYLKREVGSVGDLREVRAINWFKGSVGYVGPPSATGVLKKVEELVDLFISNYLAVNRS